jgi:hypothetical protein
MIEAQSNVEPQVEVVENTQERKVVTISGVLEDLENGLGRPLIAKKYGLNAEEMKILFQNPNLKGKRPKRATKKITFVLVDDVTPETTEEVELQQSEDSVAENDNNDDNFFELND